MIYNKKEYNQYIRELFANSSIEQFEQYETELKLSDQKRRYLTEKIRKLMKEYTETDSVIKKKILDFKLQKIRQQKADTLSANDFQISRFSVLSDGAKKYACTSALLKKYFTGELVKSNPLNFEKNANDDIIIDFEKLKNSHLHEIAVDIRDFVSFYIENEGEKVNTANHFINIYKNIKTIYELDRCIDKYYDKHYSYLDDISAGKTGVIQIKTYPEQRLQLMRITEAEGLKFESDHLGHCIRRERYIEKLNTTAEYYSIRNMKRGQPNYPFVTIYFNEGELIEVVGKSNHSIADLSIVNTTRNFIKSKLGLASDNDVINSDKIPDVAKRNMGIVKDKEGIYRDLYNLGDNELYFQTLPVTAHNLNKIKLSKLHTNCLWLQGNYSPKTFQYINRLASLSCVNISTKFNFGEQITKLDLSKLNAKSISLTGVQLRNINEIIFPDTMEELDANNIDMKNITYLDMRNCTNLQKLSFRNSNLTQTNTVLLPKKIREINIDYAKLSPALIYKLKYIESKINANKEKGINTINISFKRTSRNY